VLEVGEAPLALEFYVDVHFFCILPMDFLFVSEQEHVDVVAFPLCFLCLFLDVGVEFFNVRFYGFLFMLEPICLFLVIPYE